MRVLHSTFSTAQRRRRTFADCPQLYKRERADARADIWAVGVTLYELIAYQRPFNGESEAELMSRILSDPPPALQLTDEACA
jgi:serine/threonine protein kinase